MRLPSYCLAAFLLAAGPALAQEEEGPDIRGEWIADVNPTSKDMFVTDCACESYTEQIELTCAAKSGVVRVALNDFITEQAKSGDAAAIAFDVDGVTSTHEAKMEAFSGKEVRPFFEARLDDPLFAAIASGKTLTLSSAGKTAVSPLKGSRVAIGKMAAYCRK